MNRVEASTAVAAVTESLPQAPPNPPCQGVTAEKAHGILGEDRFAKLLRDPIRKHGPKAGYIYPWNVVDYLDEATKLG